MRLPPPFRSQLLALERRLGSASVGLRWALAALWFAVISALSHVPGTDVESTQSYLELLSLGALNVLARMGAHAAVFGLLAVLVYVALEGDFRADAASFAGAVAITGVLGLLDELHQHYVPLRHGRLADAAVDAVGAALVLAVVLWYFSRLRAPQD